MRVAALMATFVWMAAAGHSGSTFAGVWVLNHDKSDFGALMVPQRIVMRVDLADQGLTVVVLITDPQARRVAYRHVSLDGKDCGLAAASRIMPARICWVQPRTGETIDESWAISDFGELIIDRLVRAEGKVVHQRLVLEPSARLLD